MRTKVVSEAEARASDLCVKCGKPTDSPGGLVCWSCHKYWLAARTSGHGKVGSLRLEMELLMKERRMAFVAEWRELWRSAVAVEAAVEAAVGVNLG